MAGRPRRDYQPVVVQVGDFYLHPEHDADLIAFFERIPPRHRVRAIKAALRNGGGMAAAKQVAEEQYAELDAALETFL